MASQGGKRVVRAVKHSTITHQGESRFDQKIEGIEEILAVIPFDSSDATLEIKADGQSFSFYAGSAESDMAPVYENINGGFLGSESAGGFVGAYIGMFASGNGTNTGSEAAFDCFTYKGK